MIASTFVYSLEHFPPLLVAAVNAIDDDASRWRPQDGAWSILEIVSHLADEEELDFKVRLRSTLSDPAQAWPGIDPVSWATQKNYNSGELKAALNRFSAERARSIDWLRSLSQPDWSRTYEHPKIGSIRAGDLLAAWATHDYFHLRQISKRRLQLLEVAAQPYSLAYAGGSI